MKILSLDFETTWTNPVDVKKARITEIGAVLYDWETKKPLVMYSQYVHDSDYPESPAELVELTGITDETLKRYGLAPIRALTDLNHLINQADFVVAHNGSNFDKPLYYAECERNGIFPIAAHWLDSRMDIQYPKSISSRKLTFLAAEHGFLNPFSHRALFDCMTTFEILKRYDIEKVIELSKQPMIHAIAKVSFQDKHLAKDAGYYWDGEKKVWFKPMKESLFDDEKEARPFVVEMIYAPEVM